METIYALLTILTETPFGILVVLLTVGVFILAFILWYGFYAVALPIVALIFAIKIKNEGRHFAHCPQPGFTMADGGE